MEHTDWFYLGAGLNLLAAAIVFLLMLCAKWRVFNCVNNPATHRALLLFCGWLALAFLLRWVEQETLATTMLWLPGAVLLGFGLMNLLYSAFQPRA